MQIMGPSRIARRVRMLAVACCLTMAALAVPLVTGSAFAAYTVCRTDPYVTLSNGVVLQATAAITDDQSDITKVAFVLRVPSGLTVTSVQNTGSVPETVKVIANQASHHYSTAVTAYTKSSSMPVKATLTASSQSTQMTRSASGVSNTQIMVKETTSFS